MKKIILFLAAVMTAFSACVHKTRTPSSSSEDTVDVALKFDPRRGSPAEYDSGAPVESKWLELYGSTPNYRSLGIEILGGKPKIDEKFRWVFGPMWYRGRLNPESVKAFVVGQEGAQDENISNRAFTGSTGTRVQKFLNHMGIYRSYLFMNTFVYTINGQLGDQPEFKWMEQGEGSPIVEYRHKLFDYMLETNSQTVALFMGVGAGGKASLSTWINARGGKCSPVADLKNCDTSGMAAWFKSNKNIEIKNKVLAIGVPHPGGANPNLGGEEQLQNIIRGFTRAATRVAEFKEANPDWLTPDQDEKLATADLIARMKSPFKYGHAPIPFRDFAFNTNWRMGSRGTTSNRWGADSIQIFSDDGIYNDKTSNFKKVYDKNSGLNSTKTALVEMTSQDLAYESPRFNSDKKYSTPDYDYGPCGYQKSGDIPCELSKALVSWPDFNAVGFKPVSHPSFGYFGSYRGHADNSEVFVLADQTSHDDMFSTRALTGTDGQKFQSFLNASGADNKYFIARTFPVDTLGLDQTTLIKAALNEKTLTTYQRIFEAVKAKGSIKAVVAVGPVAKAVVQNMKIDNSIVTLMMDYNDSNDSWSTLASQLAQKLGQPSKPFTGALMTIPREDLPYHTRWWMGSSGDRAARGDAAVNGNYYRVWAPYWVTNLGPSPLSSKEKMDVKKQMQLHMGSAVQSFEGLEKDASE